MKKKLIFDTNALVSAVINAKSKPARVFETAKQEHHLFFSEETLAELQEVISRKKFDRYFIGNDTNRREEFLSDYRATAQLVEVTETATECRDADDNKFLALALSVGADMIVSGDSDLLVLNPYKGIRILTIGQYEEENGFFTKE